MNIIQTIKNYSTIGEFIGFVSLCALFPVLMVAINLIAPN